MNIALITIHHANSYGGTLQAFASQNVLSHYGEVRIIDYKSKALESTLHLIRLDASPRSLLRAGKDVLRLRARRRLIARFKQFMQRHYQLTASCADAQALQALSLEFDCLVCGSDQIWNPSITGSLDLNYLLAFSRARRNISFSSSAGSYCYSAPERAQVAQALGRLDRIAVREADTAQALRELLGSRVVEHTLDPTLLLDKQQWLHSLDLPQSALTGQAPYILVYTLKKDPLVRVTVEQVRRRLGLEVVAIDQDPFLGYRCDRHIMDASPADYVSLFANAAFVITNSFHGTAFAVNFGIPFVTALPENGLNRIKGFLDQLDLGSRLVSDPAQLDALLDQGMDFSRGHLRLEQLRTRTWRYLDEALLDYPAASAD